MVVGQRHCGVTRNLGVGRGRDLKGALPTAAAGAEDPRWARAAGGSTLPPAALPPSSLRFYWL